MWSIFVTGVFSEEQKFTVSDDAYYVDGRSPSLMISFQNVTPMHRKPLTFMKSQHVLPGKQSGVFPCMCCGNAYKHKRSLDDHLRFECGKPPQFQCPYCPYRTKRNGNKLKHIRNVHHKQTYLGETPSFTFPWGAVDFNMKLRSLTYRLMDWDQWYWMLNEVKP
jgi:hypothetical protein